MLYRQRGWCIVTSGAHPFTNFFTNITVAITQPLDVQPHAAPFRIAGDKLMAGHIGDPDKIAVDIKGGCLGEVLTCPKRTVIHGLNLKSGKAAA